MRTTLGILGSDVPAEHHSSCVEAVARNARAGLRPAPCSIERHRRVRPVRGARSGFARVGSLSLSGADGRHVTEREWSITTTPGRDERGAYPKTSCGPDA